MYFRLISLFLFIHLLTADLSTDWEKYKRDFNKVYSSEIEENQRRKIFSENWKQIDEFDRTHPDATFTIGINHLSDRYLHEILLNSNSFDYFQSNNEIEPRLNIPVEFDWRRRNVTTPVRNQDTQYISSAIVAVEVLESYYAIYNSELIRGSVQQVSDCCGPAVDAFDCILEKLHGGICAENVYNTSSGNCDHRSCQPFITFTEVNKLDTRKESTMLDWIQDAPLYVAMDASRESFRSYTGGIYNDDECSNSTVQHVVQLVGYGYQSGIPYWLLKNSWGENWGEKGYFRMARGKDMCGITSYVVQIPPKKPTNQAEQLGNMNIFFLIFFCFYLLKN